MRGNLMRLFLMICLVIASPVQLQNRAEATRTSSSTTSTIYIPGEMTAIPHRIFPGFGAERSMHSSSFSVIQAPSKVIEASYRYTALEPQGSHSFAHFNLYTSAPSINLDTYKSAIRFITCESRGEISILFSDSDVAAKAYEIWNFSNANSFANNSLAVFLGHETQCLGLRSIHMASVYSMNLDGRILHLSTEPLKVDQLIQGYDLHIHQMSTKPSLISNSSHKFNHDLNYNYDPIAGKVTKEEIILMSDSVGLKKTWTNVTCYHCYTNGSLGIEFKLKAKLFKIQEYMLKIDGNLVVNMDLGINLTDRHRKSIFNATLVDLPLGKLVIPGLFECGPSFQVHTGINANLRQITNFKMGFDMNVPLSVSLQQAIGNPQVERQQFTVLNAHNFSYPANLLFATFLAFVTPQVTIGVKLFDLKSLSLSIGFSNSIAAEFDPQKLSVCKNDISLYHSHMLGFEANLNPYTYHKTYWYSGRIPIPCPFCKCRDT